MSTTMQAFSIKKDSTGKKFVGQLVFVKPDQCEFTDIPQLNRAREQWSLERIDDLTTSIRERGIVVALKGYFEGNRFKITNGRQRMTAIQELARQGVTKAENGRPLLVPITLTQKPETNEEISEALEDSLVDNLHRYEDDIQTRAQSFRTLRDLGKTLEEIGKATGYSHVYVSQVLDVTGVKPLYDAVKAGKIGVKEASAFVSSKFQKLSKDNKPLKKDGQKVYDEDKIKSALTETIKKANESGRTKVKTADVTGVAGARKITGEGRKNQGIAWLKSLADDSENVPLEIRLVLDCFFMKRSVTDTIKIAKRDKIDLAWLSDVDFSSPKEKKAAKKAAKKASKATKKNPMIDDDDDGEMDSSDYEDTDE
jgi:ParB-like chromosome segregation protein Spo0J